MHSWKYNKLRDEKRKQRKYDVSHASTKQMAKILQNKEKVLKVERLTDRIRTAIQRSIFR